MMMAGKLSRVAMVTIAGANAQKSEGDVQGSLTKAVLQPSLESLPVYLAIAVGIATLLFVLSKLLCKKST